MSMLLLGLLWGGLACLTAPWIGRFCSGTGTQDIEQVQTGFHVDSG